MRLFFLSVFLFSIVACNAPQPDATANEQPAAPTEKTPAPAVAPVTTGPLLPSISNEFMKMLWENTTYVDYTFYTLPMSMSFDNQPAIQNVLGHLEARPVALPSTCKPTGRAFFQKDGEELGVAEFYLHTDCRCFVFLKDGKPAHSNRIKDQGLEFYQNSIRQAVKQTQQKAQ